ncbi:hypothetical protein [Anaerosacchariphilus polymeriproducens]|uniref:Uncharacterized protein n=1 Tax=Anaerosacchariphilus polymeriproducens TaxID=1812858 RepID=A0A371AV38_9FIRM|nr:hypothetical protein [Anaerosacchariphilus polymeriproducens]RDU23411.1 hypothetical protein DWV06_09705 [Anaerosacchariphilus polymeriproducens]
MNAVKADVEKLVKKELESANKQFPLFASNHEGYAVIKEEVEECESEYKNIEYVLDDLWYRIKANDNFETMEYLVKQIKKSAINLAIEAIQAAAMCDKFIMSQKKREN